MFKLPPFPQPAGPQWGGMTLDEIRMRRTLVQARMEIQKFKMTAQMESMKASAPLFGGSNSIFSRVSGVFSVAEYGLFAFKIIRMILPFLRRKKK